MKEVLVAKDLVKTFGSGAIVTAIDGISLSIKEGEFVSIMGPSGSGKSTLLNILATLDVPTKGKVLINGENLMGIGDQKLSKFRRENISYIFQDYNLLGTLTIRENIAVPLTFTEMKKEEIDKRVDEVSKKLDITRLLDKYPGECSGGERQRAAACRALATRPKIIVADEPTGALDTKNAHELLSTLEALNKSEGITILLVTHDSMIATYSKRILFIRDGKIEEELIKGNDSQEEFFHKIVSITSRESYDIFNRRKAANQ